MRARLLSSLLVVVAVILGSCGEDTLVARVEAGTYTARVPTEDQLADPGADALPGAFMELRRAGVDHVEITVGENEVEISADGAIVASRSVEETVQLLAQEPTSAFQSRIEAEFVRLAGEPLEMPGLTIARPSVSPARANDPSVIALRAFERTPPVDLGCLDAGECLLATTGISPAGEYRSVPEGTSESPVTSIAVVGDTLELRLASGETVTAVRPDDPDEATTPACGITETAMWEVPDETGLGMDDPVVVHTSCLGVASGSYLTLIERSDIPVLAPWGNPVWCDLGPIDASAEGTSPDCWVFARPE